MQSIFFEIQNPYFVYLFLPSSALWTTSSVDFVLTPFLLSPSYLALNSEEVFRAFSYLSLNCSMFRPMYSLLAVEVSAKASGIAEPDTV